MDDNYKRKKIHKNIHWWGHVKSYGFSHNKFFYVIQEIVEDEIKMSWRYKLIFFKTVSVFVVLFLLCRVYSNIFLQEEEEKNEKWSWFLITFHW